MRIKRLWLALFAASAVGAACGEGHAIFNIDVFSFISGAANDTLPYAVLPASGGTVQIPPIAIKLLSGAANSNVDTVTISGGALVDNQTGGPGTLAFKLYFSSDSNTVYSTTPIFTTNAGAGPAGADSTLVFNATLTSAQDSLFNEPKLFVGIAATLTNPSASTLSGVLRLTALNLRVVLEDKIFN
jgi:hypothetical protein